MVMVTKAKRPIDTASESKTVRTSIGFPAALHKALEDIAKEKKVSVAWIVRDAAEQYVAGRWPLLTATPNRPSAPSN